MMALHKRMFGDVWTWAGTQRRRETNIGVAPSLIATQCRLLFDDAGFWHEQQAFGQDELAARVHCRLVSIHPFPNGNGRCTRMVADVYLASIGAQPFSWGRAGIDVDGSVRARYMAALLNTVASDEYSELSAFARGET